MNFPGNQSCDGFYVITLLKNTTNRKQILDSNVFGGKKDFFFLFSKSRQIPASVYCTSPFR